MSRKTVYFDSFPRLVPVKVLRHIGDKVTGTRSAYKLHDEEIEIRRWLGFTDEDFAIIKRHNSALMVAYSVVGSDRCARRARLPFFWSWVHTVTRRIDLTHRHRQELWTNSIY